MNWHDALGLAATIAFMLPAIIIVWLRLLYNNSFLALFAYYVLVLVHNLLTEVGMGAPPQLIRGLGITNNFLDLPLILSFLIFFSMSAKISKQIKAVMLCYIAFELIIIGLFGFSKKAITITIGPGIVIILIYCTYFFFQQSRITIMYRQYTGRAIMVASLIFAYGCYGLIYLFHYVLSTPNVDDIFSVFHIVSIVSSIMMATGMWIERKKIANLMREKNNDQDNEELFKNKPAASYRTAGYDENDFKYH